MCVSEERAPRKRRRRHPPKAVLPLTIVAVVVLLLASRDGSTTTILRRSLSLGLSLDEAQPLPPAVLPSYLEDNLSAVASSVPVDQSTETAVFWHVPKAGGTTMRNYVACLGLVQANQLGTKLGHGKDTELEVFESQPGYKVVNVDTTTKEGLLRASSLNLARSGLADVLFTSHPHEAARIFDTDHRGRMFTLLRHPVDREISKFYYLQDAYWESGYAPETKSWSIQRYAISRRKLGNFMVRKLSDSRPGNKLTTKDLELAKAFLKEKFVVGLLDEIEESVDRFGRYLDWDDGGSGRSEECADRLLKPGTGSNRHPHPKVQPGSDDWNAMAKNEYWDIKLYNYVVELFQEQAGLAEPHLPDNEGAGLHPDSYEEGLASQEQ